jgi:predicted PurR-regulated permease PerM
LSQALLTFVDITTLVLLVPLYAFLMLMYKDLIIEFFLRLFAGKNMSTIQDVLQEARVVVKGYVVGLMIETAIIAVLNSIALLLLGIDYAILFGILAALLNLIPYVGILIGGLLPFLMALITKDSAWYSLGVVASFSVIQFIDNNFIVPYVVASRVSINALISIVAVIIGGMLWGISGMFLSLPAVAILKIIFDRVETLKPWGLILGDVIPSKRTKKAARL